MSIVHKTPTQITRFLDENLHKFDNPACYLGTEPNTYQWTDEQWKGADLRASIVAPFDYLQAIGNTTVPLLYQLVNERSSAYRVLERNYFPTSRKEVDMLRNAGVPPFGFETRHSLGEYDLLAIPINYPTYWFNIVMSLRMAGISVREKDRTAQLANEPQPLIMVGGHAYANPWFMSPVVDLIWCGEAEDETKEAQEAIYRSYKEQQPGWQNIPTDDRLSPSFWWVQPRDNPGFNAFLDTVAKVCTSGQLIDPLGREEFLHDTVKQFKNIFVPKFYQLHHAKNKKGFWVTTGWTPKYTDIPQRVQKRIVRNLDAVSAPLHPPIPFQDPNMGMGTVQAARGCTYRCGFCAASYREVPYRERSQDVMFSHMAESMKYTGASEVSPLTLEFGTYTRKKALMKQVLENLTDEFSMPSLRVDVFGGDPVFGQLAVHAQKKNVTIALEGNSQRLREIVSKGIQEEDILLAFSNALAAGYQSAKLYMVCNLPGETAADHEELYQTCLKLDNLRRSVDSKMKVRLSWKPLAVQAWTPFQWLAARTWSANMGESLRKIQALGFGTQIGDETKSSLGNFIQVAELADDVAAEALLDTIIESDAITYGALPRRIHEILLANLAKRGRTLEDYYREKDFPDEVFPWDIIDPLLTKSYLIRHYASILERLGGTAEIFGKGFLERFGSCNIGCTQCGACDTESLTVMEAMATRVDEPVKLSEIKTIDRKTVRQKLILWADIASDKRYADKSFWTHAIRRACYMTGVNIATKSIRFMTDRVKTLKPWYAGREYIELGLVTATDDVVSLSTILEPYLSPYGMTIQRVEEVALSTSIQARYLDAILWELEIDQPVLHLQEALRRAISSSEVMVKYKIDKYRTGVVQEEMPVSQAIREAFVHQQGRHVKLVMSLHPNISPYDAANAIIGHRTDIYRYPATGVAGLTGLNGTGDAFSKFCKECDKPIPFELDIPFNLEYCPRHYYQAKNARPASDQVMV